MNEAGRFQSGGVSLAYDLGGEGPPVVLVHGFASSFATNWGVPGTFKILCDAGFQVAGLDNRGHGRSDRPRAPGAYRLQVMVQDVVDLIQALDLKRPALIGYSMGARIVLALLSQRPDLARTAILGGVGEGLERAPLAFSEKVSAALLAPDPAELTDPIARRFRLFAEHQGGDLAALAQCIQEVSEAVDFGFLADIDFPVMVIAGAKDDQISSPAGLAARIPGARLEIIPDRNHNTVVGDPRFQAAITNFLMETR